MKRKALLKKISCVIVTGLLSAMVLIGCNNKETNTTHVDNIHEEGVTFEVAENAIIEGNKRFVSGDLAKKDLSLDERTNLSENGQHPFATIITCSDSRVSPELIFDQGLGDLFVIRDAGNVAGTLEIGSVEYAVEHAKTPLVIVMAHDKCGAVDATIKGGEATPSLQAIIDIIKPSLNKVKAENKDMSDKEIASEVENENAKVTVNELLKSTVIKELVDSGKLKVVAAKYHLESGEVEFFK